MINSDNLNDYSNKVYSYLKKNKPELIEQVILCPSDFGKNHIHIEFNSNNKNSSSNLILSSQNNEITVGFDCYHNHFDHFSDQDFESEMQNAIECFEKILNEKLFVVSAGGGASRLMTKEEINKLERGQLLEYFDYPCINYYVTSWSGNFDKIFKNTV